MGAWVRLLDGIGREPAQILGVVSAGIVLLSTVYPLTVEQQGALNAAAVAAVGLVTALLVHSEKAAAVAAGLLQAIVALGLSFGLALPPQTQASAMAFVAAITALYLRTQLVAAVPPMDVGGRHSRTD